MTTQEAGGVIEDYWKEQFDFLQVNPLVWALDADSLMRSFDIVSQQAERDFHERIKRAEVFLARQDKNEGAIPYHQPYIPEVGQNAMMLGALATETLLKASALSVPSIQMAVQLKDKQVVNRLWTHHLRDIAKMAGAQLQPQEVALCERLECFLIWSGRYSTPKDHLQMMPRELADGGFATPNTYSSADFGSIRSLTMRLRASLPSINSN